MGVASPLQIATLGSALIWPLAAGIAVVVWYRARAARRRRLAATDDELKGLYHSLEQRPVPARLAMVVEALEEGEELAPTASPKDKAGAASAKS
jgi:hypothetical protein